MPTIRNQEYGRNGRRSAEWLDRRDLDGFLHRSWLKSEGFSDESFRGRPLIGICNSWSELVNCNVHLRGLAEAVKRGVLQAGGFPLEFPVISLGESLMKPTTMLYRNLMAMDVEESIRAYPLDGVVLLTRLRQDEPGVGHGHGERGRARHRRHRRAHAERQLAGRGPGFVLGLLALPRGAACRPHRRAEFAEIEDGMSRSHGHCMTMGTASTMACVTEGLGLSPARAAAAFPLPTRAGRQLAEASGRKIVELVERGSGPRT